MVLVAVVVKAIVTVVVVVAVAVMVVTVLEVRMEGCHLGMIISVMSGKAVGASGSNQERSLIFFQSIQVLISALQTVLNRKL